MDSQTVVEAEPDFHSRAWWLDEFGRDNRPYTAQEWPAEPGSDVLSDPVAVFLIEALLWPILFGPGFAPSAVRGQA